jgi:hypothetical protein
VVHVVDWLSWRVDDTAASRFGRLLAVTHP